MFTLRAQNGNHIRIKFYLHEIRTLRSEKEFNKNIETNSIFLVNNKTKK